jgi:hypothetical protein
MREVDGRFLLVRDLLKTLESPVDDMTDVIGWSFGLFFFHKIVYTPTSCAFDRQEIERDVSTS